MNAAPDLVTVYRSMDASAKDDCAEIIEMLSEEGVRAVLWDDSFPGVPEGAFEVRVPSGLGPKAEKLIAENPLADEVEAVDPSARLDLETIFQAGAGGNTSEIEALGIKNLLEANGIAVVLVGDSVLPNLPFEVRVARDQAGRARQLIAEAESLGSTEAEESEAQS